MTGRGNSLGNPQVLGGKRFGGTKGVKAGGSTSTLPLRPARSLSLFPPPVTLGGLLSRYKTSKCFVVFVFSSFGAHLLTPLCFILYFCRLNTLRASPVPSLSCEAPPQQGHKVLEAGTRYPWVETAKLTIKTYPDKDFQVFWIIGDNVSDILLNTTVALTRLFRPLNLHHNFSLKIA